MSAERECTSLRCGDECWGLPGCQHPDRTPFYDLGFRVGRWGADSPEGAAYIAILEWQALSRDPGHLAPFLMALALIGIVVIGGMRLWL